MKKFALALIFAFGVSFGAFASGRDGLSLGAFVKYDNRCAISFGFEEGHRIGDFVSDLGIGFDSDFSKITLSYALGGKFFDLRLLHVDFMVGADFNAKLKDIDDTAEMSALFIAAAGICLGRAELRPRAFVGCNFALYEDRKKFVYGCGVSMTWSIGGGSSAKTVVKYVEAPAAKESSAKPASGETRDGEK